MALLQGPVVFIDDQLHDDATPAFALAQTIRDSGRPLAAYTELPPTEHQDQWKSLAFLVLDWDLVAGSPGQYGATLLSDYAREELLDWLEAFLAAVFCPVFIVSAEDVDDISRRLSEVESLSRVVRTGRLRVFSKDEVRVNFLQYLDDWVASKPALAALNVWANEYEAATSRLFQDMDQLASDWPVYVWNVAEEDRVDPSFELASVLSANLLHRIDSLQFDLPGIREHTEKLEAATLRRVMRGRTLVLARSLYPTMVLPGDLFRDPDEDTIFWVNVTPACHTVLNRPPSKDSAPDPDSVRLHLIPGELCDRPTSRKQLTTLEKREGSNSMLVHTLLDDGPVLFKFKGSRHALWGEVRERRIGRLLPPYITLMQQKHAAFLMNEGVPRIGFDLYDDGPVL